LDAASNASSKVAELPMFCLIADAPPAGDDMNTPRLEFILLAYIVWAVES
jgi:hypothetical protein